MKTKKKLLSIVLVLAMVFSVYVPTPAKAEVGVDSVDCYVRIHTPYKEYFQSENFNDYVYLEKSDLEDDFGIGLSTGSDAGFTALRALAKMVRNGIMNEKNLDSNDSDDKAVANEYVKNYIKVEPSEYGLMLYGISDDGVNWNTGAYKEPGSTASTTDFSEGYWAFYVDEKISDVGIDSYALKVNYTEIELSWKSTLNSGEYDYAGRGEITIGNYGYSLPNKEIKGNVYGIDYTGSKTPVEGAEVTILELNTTTYDYEIVDTVKTDSSGGFIVKKLPAGSYKLCAVADEVNETTNLTHSKIEYTRSYLYVDAPAKAKSIKTKAKKSGKKYNLTVSWKNGDKYADSRTVYYVYLSKKKNSGYSKKAVADGITPKATIKKLKKGTYYVKIRTLQYYGNDDEVVFKSGYTTPVKVKVK